MISCKLMICNLLRDCTATYCLSVTYLRRYYCIYNIIHYMHLCDNRCFHNRLLPNRKLHERVNLISPVAIVVKALEVNNKNLRQLPQIKLLGCLLMFFALWTVPEKMHLTIHYCRLIKKKLIMKYKNYMGKIAEFCPHSYWQVVW